VDAPCGCPVALPGWAARKPDAKNMVKAGRKTIPKDGRELQRIDFTVSANPGDDVQAQFGLMVDQIYQWHEEFGETCGALSIDFVGPPPIHEALMACLAAFIQQEDPLRPLFHRLGHLEVACVTPDGQVLNESELKLDIG
jgi:hypothetical protein